MTFWEEGVVLWCHYGLMWRFSTTYWQKQSLLHRGIKVMMPVTSMEGLHALDLSSHCTWAEETSGRKFSAFRSGVEKKQQWEKANGRVKPLCNILKVWLHQLQDNTPAALNPTSKLNLCLGAQHFRRLAVSSVLCTSIVVLCHRHCHTCRLARWNANLAINMLVVYFSFGWSNCLYTQRGPGKGWWLLP